MNKLIKIVAFLVVLPLATVGATCNADQVNKLNQAVVTAVDAAQFACIEASVITDSKEVAVVCGIVKAASDIVPDLLKLIDQIVLRRELLKKSGYSYEKKTASWSK